MEPSRHAQASASVGLVCAEFAFLLRSGSRRMILILARHFDLVEVARNTIPDFLIVSKCFIVWVTKIIRFDNIYNLSTTRSMNLVSVVDYDYRRILTRNSSLPA